MKKIITLALVLAGVCSLNAAPREFKVRPGQEIATLQPNSAASTRAAAPNRAATLRGDTIPANNYTWNFEQYVTNTANQKKWIQQANTSVIVPGTQNVKEDRYYAWYTGFNGLEDESPIIGQLSEDGYTLTFPVGQTFLTLQHQQFGTLNMQIYNVCTDEEGHLEIDDKNPVVLKREQNKWVAYEQASQVADYTGYFYVGAKIIYEGEEGFVGYGYFCNHTLQQMNCQVLQYNYDSNLGTVIEQLGEGVYNLVYGMWIDRNGDDLIVRNLFGLGQDELTTFHIDHTAKTIETDEMPTITTVYVNEQFGYVDLFPVSISSEGESYTIKANYEVSTTEQGATITKFTFDFDELALCATLGTQAAVYSDYTSMRWVYPYDLDDLSAGVENAVITEANNAPVEYFNLQGIRINRENAANGVYIRRQGNEVSKIVL